MLVIMSKANWAHRMVDRRYAKFNVKISNLGDVFRYKRK